MNDEAEGDFTDSPIYAWGSSILMRFSHADEALPR